MGMIWNDPWSTMVKTGQRNGSELPLRGDRPEVLTELECYARVTHWLFDGTQQEWFCLTVIFS